MNKQEMEEQLKLFLLMERITYEIQRAKAPKAQNTDPPPSPEAAAADSTEE